jgi:hypothetical protein
MLATVDLRLKAIIAHHDTFAQVNQMQNAQLLVAFLFIQQRCSHLRWLRSCSRWLLLFALLLLLAHADCSMICHNVARNRAPTRKEVQQSSTVYEQRRSYSCSDNVYAFTHYCSYSMNTHANYLCGLCATLLQ